MDIDKQWDEWSKVHNVDDFECLSDTELKDLIIEDLKVISKMSVEEYTLYKKMFEINQKYPVHEVSTLFGTEKQLVNIDEESILKKMKENIWVPENVDDYLKLKPKLICTTGAGSKLSDEMNKLRTFLSTGRNNNNVGRNLYYIIIDEVTGKYLGVNTLSSDYLDLTPRDQFIGWDRELKTKKMINHTTVGSTIVPTQPFGYNYVGGKLLALLCLADQVQEDWKRFYGDKLVAVTTTSLYGKNKVGGLSQYDRLSYWKKMGYTAGSVSFEASKPVIKEMLKWLRKNYPRKYFEWYVAVNENGQPYKRDHRNRSYTFIYSQLKVPKEYVKTDHGRGIYFAPLYTNTNEFLRGEITEDKLVKAFPTDIESLTNLWKTKYAAKRIRSLVEQNRVSSETLFYDDLCYMDWNEVRDKYLKEVGR